MIKNKYHIINLVDSFWSTVELKKPILLFFRWVFKEFLRQAKLTSSVIKCQPSFLVLKKNQYSVPVLWNSKFQEQNCLKLNTMLMHYILIKLKILFDVIKMYSIYFITLHSSCPVCTWTGKLCIAGKRLDITCNKPVSLTLVHYPSSII